MLFVSIVTPVEAMKSLFEFLHCRTQKQQQKKGKVNQIVVEDTYLFAVSGYWLQSGDN